MEELNIFENRFHELIKSGVTTLQIAEAEQTIPKNEPKTEKPQEREQEKTQLTCSFCKVDFKSGVDQREHYKSDWHRYNLKRNMRGKDPITEEQFNEGSSDLFNLSDSESEEEETLQSLATAQGRVFLKNTEGKIFSLYKCLLADRKVTILFFNYFYTQEK